MLREDGETKGFIRSEVNLEQELLGQSGQCLGEMIVCVVKMEN